MKTYDDYYWEIVRYDGYETRICYDTRAKKKAERLEKENSRLKSMSLFQRIFRWEKE
jgi:hypothetical protein